MNICVICGNIYTEGWWFTCSQTCHGELINHLIARFGEFKKVVRMSTGVAYKVPTRDILEEGIQEQYLDQYPLWEDITLRES